MTESMAVVNKRVRARMRLVVKARTALAKLEPGEQALLFREFGRCACAEIAKLTKHPDVAVGAVVGGIIGGLLGLGGKK